MVRRLKLLDLSFSADHGRQDLAPHQHAVLFHGGALHGPRQRDDRVADDARVDQVSATVAACGHRRVVVLS